MKLSFLYRASLGAMMGLTGAHTTLADEAVTDRRAEAEQVLETYFARIGGREKFAAAHGEYIAIEITDPERAPVPFYFELCFSYDAARGATRANSVGGTSLSAYDIDHGWTVSRKPGQPAALKSWDQNRLQAALMDWRGNFEVLTHRLAARDPDVFAVTGEGPWQGWLEIYENEEPVFHLMINDKGEPVQFRRILDDNAVRFGPLVDFGGYSFPRSGHFEGSYNTFDFHIFRLIDTPLTQAFTAPDNLENPAMNCR